MPYCPKCRAEFHEDVAICADCNLPLVAVLPVSTEDDDRGLEYLDLYLAPDNMEAENIKVLLQREDIPVLLKDRTCSALPMNIGELSGVTVAVAEQDRTKAKALLQEAIQDEYISPNGTFF